MPRFLRPCNYRRDRVSPVAGTGFGLGLQLNCVSAGSGDFTPEGNQEESRMLSNRISRRTVLKGSVAAGALGMAGVPARAAEPNWKKHAGTSLEVFLTKGPRGELLEKYAKEFT